MTVTGVSLVTEGCCRSHDNPALSATKLAEWASLTLELPDLPRCVAGVALSFLLLFQSHLPLACSARSQASRSSRSAFSVVSLASREASSAGSCVSRAIFRSARRSSPPAPVPPLGSLPQDFGVIHIAPRPKSLLRYLLGARCCASSLAESRLLKFSHFSPSPLSQLPGLFAAKRSIRSPGHSK